jgi:hypothetical protein
MLGEIEKHVDDAGLSAAARVHGLIVVTRNVKDFNGRVVKLFDPFKATCKTSNLGGHPGRCVSMLYGLSGLLLTAARR